jgi:hypothetical protein
LRLLGVGRGSTAAGSLAVGVGVRVGAARRVERGDEVGAPVDATAAVPETTLVVTQTPFFSFAGGVQSASWVTVGVGTGA